MALKCLENIAVTDELANFRTFGQAIKDIVHVYYTMIEYKKRS